MFTHNIYRNIRTRVIIIHDGRMLLGAPRLNPSSRFRHPAISRVVMPHSCHTTTA
jgi:hypothetical protein